MSVFTIAADGQSITCRTCGLTGRNLSDVAGHCGCFRLLLDPRQRRAEPEHDIKPEGRAEAQV